MHPSLYPIYPMIIFRIVRIPGNLGVNDVVVIAFVSEHFKLL